MAEKSTLTVHLDEEQRSFLVLSNGIEETKALLRENLGGEQLSIRDLERTTNPSGKSTKWAVEGLDGEQEMISEITGVIIAQQPYRIYWSKSFEETGGKEPADCISTDMIHGEGTPGGLCAKCPFSQWGSGKTKDSQACNQRRRVFVLRPDEMLPMQITLSPVNYNALKSYAVKLTNKKQLRLHQVLSKVHMVTASSPNGFDYAKVIFSLVEPLPESVASAMHAYQRFLEPQLLATPFEDDPGYEVEDDDPVEVERPDPDIDTAVDDEEAPF